MLHLLQLVVSGVQAPHGGAGRQCRGNREKLPGKQGETAGETGRKGRGNGNTAAAVSSNTARC